MGRKLLIRSDFQPYHVSARTNDRMKFPLSDDEMWEITSFEILSICTRIGAEIHAFVLMPNHFHMLLTIPNFDLGIVMHTFMRNVAVTTNKRANKSGHLFGGPYHWSLINSSNYFYHVLKYVYRNPIKAGLCKNVEDYPYSSYSGLIGLNKLPFPIHFTRAGMEHRLPGLEPIKWLDWINRPFFSDSEEAIRLGLKRKIFQTPADRVANREIGLPD